jgi:hypothetical protein
MVSADMPLVPAEHFNLPHPEQFDSWSTSRFYPASDTNPSIFEGFGGKPSRLECRDYAP